MNALQSLAAIIISGADAKSFLQGQLSNDLNILSADTALLASCNSGQGRVQSILTLLERDDGIAAIVPVEMVDLMLPRLRKYILRSKVIVNDGRPSLICCAATRAQLEALRLPIPSSPGLHHQIAQTSVVRWWDQKVERYLVLKSPESEVSAIDDWWLLSDIQAGLPQVLPQTYESYVAQMLNLDVIGGISFSKGCYTGQEIIARSHYRGAVKRRMFRLSANCDAPLPSARIVTTKNGAHAGDVVMAVGTENGCEMLAVLNLSQVNTPLGLETDSSTTLALLPLPYDVPTLTT